MKLMRAMTTDAELIRQARNDPAAFGMLYRRHAASVHAFLRGRAPDRVAAELTAETFAQAALSLKRFRDEMDGSGLPWLYGIARNLLRTYYERERIVAHTKRVGEGLIAVLRDLSSAEIVDVRGRGLLVGVELSGASGAARVVDSLREAGVLIGRTGKRDNVLKIRPPLVFDDEHTAILIDGLRRAL